jgi:hypothetical protein
VATDPPAQLVDLEETRALLGDISRASVYRLYDRGKIKRVKVLGKVTTHLPSIHDYIREQLAEETARLEAKETKRLAKEAKRRA